MNHATITMAIYALLAWSVSAECVSTIRVCGPTECVCGSAGHSISPFNCRELFLHQTPPGQHRSPGLSSLWRGWHICGRSMQRWSQLRALFLLQSDRSADLWLGLVAKCRPAGWHDVLLQSPSLRIGDDWSTDQCDDPLPRQWTLRAVAVWFGDLLVRRWGDWATEREHPSRTSRPVEGASLLWVKKGVFRWTNF